MSVNTCKFQGLPDTTGDVEAAYFSTAAAALRLLRTYRCVTAAKDYGAIHIWRDDNGVLRGELSRWMITRDQQIFKTLVAARLWIAASLVAIQEQQ